MTTLLCAKCRSRFEPDDDHAWVEMEYRTIDDANETDEYALCSECWLEVRDNWGEPV